LFLWGRWRICFIFFNLKRMSFKTHLKKRMNFIFKDERQIVKYVIDLANRNKFELGFIPDYRYFDYYRKGKILIEFENDEPCGFFLFNQKDSVIKIYQACVEFDLRRLKKGENLLRRLLFKAHKSGAKIISLYCMDILEANLFWQAVGFQFCCKRAGGQEKKVVHNHWILWIDKPEPETLIKAHTLSPVAQVKKIIVPQSSYIIQSPPAPVLKNI
jgi:hypothetical protein